MKTTEALKTLLTEGTEGKTEIHSVFSFSVREGSNPVGRPRAIEEFTE
jgi:hypothetical protein